MKKLLVALAIFLSGSITLAAGSSNQFGIAAGVHSNDASSDLVDIQSKTSFQVGGLAIIDTGSSTFGVRTGFFYTQRNLDFKPDGEIKLTYFDIPVTALFKFNEWGGAFIGPVLALNASKDCSLPGTGCTIDPKGLNVGLQVGATYRFAPFLGAEVYYEMLPGDITDGTDVKDYKTIGANFVVYFD